MNDPLSDRLALSPVAIPQCRFEDAFGLVADAGFTAIGLRYNQLEDYLARGHTLGQVRDLLKRHGLRFAEAAFVAEWQFHGGLPLICTRRRQGGPAEADALLMQRLRTFMEHCSELECRNITAAPALNEIGDLAVAAEDFAQLCDFAQPYGLRMCLEFMGSAPQVNNIKTAFDMVTAANRPNGGLLIDTFLFHEGNSRLADIALVPGSRIFNVQLADAKPIPREQLNMLEDRLYPGEGVAPIESIVAMANEAGYSGYWTVELFNPEYAKQPAADVVKHAYRAAASILRNVAQSGKTAVV